MKTKTYLELLIILREYIVNDNCFKGMCISLIDLKYDRGISSDEEIKLGNFIDINRPRRGKLYDKKQKDGGYYWPKYKITPRLDWLNHHIKKLSK